MVLSAYIALSPVTGLVCHRHRRFRQLDTSVGASGPHDLAVRFGDARLASPPHPSHPAPNVRDDAYAPLIEAGRTSRKFDLPDGESEIFFAGGLDRKIASGATDLPVWQNHLGPLEATVRTHESSFIGAA